MINNLKNIEKIINLKFNDKELLSKSFIHKSYNKKINNEKLEFLGDRVIGLAISKKLLTLYPNENEGNIDKKFSNLVNKKTCADVAKRLNIKKFIKTGKSIDKPININDNNREISMDTTKTIENLNIDEAKYFDFDISAELKVKSGDWKYILTAEDENGFKIKNPYEFTVKTRAVEPPRIILADYAVENNFGTNYIPKNEEVDLTVRIQNVGQGITEKVEFSLLDNHTYESIDFTGYIELSEMKPGEFSDITFNHPNWNKEMDDTCVEITIRREVSKTGKSRKLIAPISSAISSSPSTSCFLDCEGVTQGGSR